MRALIAAFYLLAMMGGWSIIIVIFGLIYTNQPVTIQDPDMLLLVLAGALCGTSGLFYMVGQSNQTITRAGPVGISITTLSNSLVQYEDRVRYCQGLIDSGVGDTSEIEADRSEVIRAMDEIKDTISLLESLASDGIAV